MSMVNKNVLKIKVILNVFKIVWFKVKLLGW